MILAPRHVCHSSPTRASELAKIRIREWEKERELVKERETERELREGRKRVEGGRRLSISSAGGEKDPRALVAL